MKHQILLFIIANITILTLVSACGTPNAEEEPTEIAATQIVISETVNNEIIVLMQAEPETLVWYYPGVVAIAISRNSYESLVTRNATGDLEPALAESWEQIDDDTWRFHLRHGVTSHDGEPFNAAVVAWHIQQLSLPEFSNTPIVSFLGGKLSAEEVDEFTVDISTELPDPILPRRLYWLFMSSPTSVEADPEIQDMVGTGPYKLESWTHGENIVMVANPDYWDGEPTIKKVTFIWREDAALRLAMLRAGEVDIAQAILPEEDISVRVLTADIPETPFIRIDPNPPMDDIRVRQAICMAMNREEIAEDIFSGFAKPATQLITPDVMGYNTDIALWPYDPEQAQALIEEARADGVPIELEITIIGRVDMYTNATKAMEDLQLWLAEIGLNVRLDMSDTSTWRDLMRTNPIPEDRRFIFQSSHGNEAGDGIFTMNAYYHSNGHLTSFPNPIMDNLISEAAPLTGEARQDALAEALAYQHNKIVQDCPLVHLQAVWGVSDDINWEPRFDGLILVKTVSIR